MSMNLRELVNKYGRNKGLHVQAVKCFGHQLFIALNHLDKLGIIHADLKPDNILVNEEQTSIDVKGSVYFRFVILALP